MQKRISIFKQVNQIFFTPLTTKQYNLIYYLFKVYFKIFLSIFWIRNFYFKFGLKLFKSKKFLPLYFQLIYLYFLLTYLKLVSIFN